MSYYSIKRYLLSENNDHTVTDQPKTSEIKGFRDGVTVATDDYGKSQKPNGDIQVISDYHMAKYRE